QQQVHFLVVRGEVAKEVEGGTIQPLQIVQEEHERMLGAREHAHEALQDSVETRLSLLRRKIRDGLLGANDHFDVGNEVDDELSVHAERPPDVFAPSLECGVTREENRAHKVAEGADDRGERSVTLVWLELTRSEEAASTDYYLLEFVDDGGLADARVSRNE